MQWRVRTRAPMRQVTGMAGQKQAVEKTMWPVLVCWNCRALTCSVLRYPTARRALSAIHLLFRLGYAARAGFPTRAAANTDPAGLLTGGAARPRWPEAR